MELYNLSLIIMYIGMLITFIVSTGSLKSKKENWGKFWVITFFSALIGGLILTFLILYPEQISKWSDIITEMLKSTN